MWRGVQQSTTLPHLNALPSLLHPSVRYFGHHNRLRFFHDYAAFSQIREFSYSFDPS